MARERLPLTGTDGSGARAGGRLFDAEFLRRLEYLRLVSRNLLPGGLKGEHRARRRGSGVEFADYRPYVPGDDVRHVDWRAYLRLGKLLLRLFEEEGDLPIYIFVDSSRSMVQGRDRLTFSLRIAAALCFVGLSNLDRVSLIAFADGVRDELSQLRGQNQVWSALRFLERIEAGGAGSDLHASARDFFAQRRRRGLVAVISDFLDEDHERGLDLLRQLRHDVLLLHMVDDDEPFELPDDVELVDAESGESRRLRVTPGLLRSYQATRVRLAADLEARARREGWSYVPVQPDMPFDRLVLEIFRQGRFLT